MAKKPHLLWPTDAPLSDRYGRRDAIPGVVGASFHTGDDLAADEGTLLYAPAPGVVSAVWFDRFVNGAGAGGNMIEMNHGDIGGVNVRTRIAHMRDPSNKRVGDRLTLDSVVGVVGSTGAATGPHAHVEVLINGSFVNPSLYMRPRSSRAAETENKVIGDDDMIRNIRGKKGVRDAGAYLFKDGIVRWIGPFISSEPIIDDQDTITRLFKQYKFVK